MHSTLDHSSFDLETPPLLRSATLRKAKATRTEHEDRAWNSKLTFELEPLTSEHEGLTSERQSPRLAAEDLASEHEGLTSELHHFSSEQKTLTMLRNTGWTQL